MNWLFNNYIEILGAISGLVFLWLEYKENALLWPLGILTSFFYIFVFYSSKFYADMGLQFYYLFISVYGWYIWVKKKPSNSDNCLKIKTITSKLALKLLLATIVLFFIIYYILKNYTDSPIPVGDAFISSLSIIATWMLTRKILEQWLVWIVANAVSLALFLYRGMIPTSILFAAYTIIAIAGYFEWRKKMKYL